MEHTYTVALAGNPNVGKSTVFNRLTGCASTRATGPARPWSGQRVIFSQAGQRFRLVDLPGTYSLAADSPEEEVAGAFLQSGQADAVIVVVDASRLRRGLILALRLRQQTQRLVLCVNLMDEAARRGVTPQIRRLGALDVPVVATAARSGKGLGGAAASGGGGVPPGAMGGRLEADLRPAGGGGAGTAGEGMSRRRAVALLWGSPPTEGNSPCGAGAERLGALLRAGPAGQPDGVGGGAGGGDRAAVRPVRGRTPHAPDRRLDRLLTSRLTGFPVMLLLLGLVFYLTIQGAPSRLLSRWLTALEEPLRGPLAGAPWWVQGLWWTASTGRWRGWWR